MNINVWFLVGMAKNDGFLLKIESENEIENEG